MLDILVSAGSADMADGFSVVPVGVRSSVGFTFTAVGVSVAGASCVLFGVKVSVTGGARVAVWVVSKAGVPVMNGVYRIS
jgi:hypothetical protein